jgi:mono/diheme cytochrome c family protein
MLGLTIGVILLVKISILRWFRHFEEWMPALGVGLLLCTVLLVGLSLPIALRAGGQVGHDAFDEANRARVRGLLDGAGFAAGTDLDALASADGLREGRRVLLDECTFCHDLKTAIARPRTPADWRHTVERMAEKPTLGPRLDPGELDRVTAYLVAITPDLQQSAKAKRAEDEERAASARAAEELERDLDAGPLPAADAGAVAVAPTEPTPTPTEPAPPAPAPAKPAVDLARAKAAYQRVCSQCHPTSDTDDAPPKSRRAVDALIARMVDNGLEASRGELALVRAHLLATYVGK